MAVNLSPALKDSLIDLQNTFYDAGIRGNYTRKENLHLTLAFIGDYPDAETVLAALRGVSFTPFSLTLDGVGSFGDLWWAGIRSSPALDAVVRRICRALAEKDIPFDRKRFSPHITLLRNATVSALPPVAISPVSMTVDEVALMSSTRGKSGMIYTEVGVVTAGKSQ